GLGRSGRRLVRIPGRSFRNVTRRYRTEQGGMTPLTDEQKRDAVLITSVGCDRETAAKYAGCTADELNNAIDIDHDFADQLQRAEAGCELAHMRTIQQAGRDERHWRASVWWLERRLPERYARRGPGSVGRRELVRFLEAVATGVATAVRDESDRQRVVETLQELTQAIPGVAEEDTDAGGSRMEVA
ncbi:MAG: hypothetical protein AAF266_03530, partial [Planctomycetota bacterium]